MHEAIKFYDTVLLTLSEKLALKTPKVLIKMAFFVAIELFFRTIDVDRFVKLKGPSRGPLKTQIW
jgi:hypothetical protein